tara:strand:- start:3676 stop:3978 length:303 start_codon:yes stop_codon:yes gene_type:complete
MTTQTVVITPSTEMSSSASIDYIASLLPTAVINHLATTAGVTRTVSTSSNGNTHTIVTTWSDDTDKETFKTLMADVSSGVISTLESEGWAISFTPLTADL